MPTLAETLERLYARRTFGVKLGLDLMERLVDERGHPERAYPVIHVAGTNGKGSVCAMLASMLNAAGYRTGLYISPHLVRFNERFQVGGEPIADEELAETLAEVESVCDAVAETADGREATFFEAATLVGFEHFRKSAVDIAVIETGLGGRLDATNVVDPVLSVITRIGMDHTGYLGETLEAITEEKCGIVKPDRPVLVGDMARESLMVVRTVAGERGSGVCEAGQLVSVARRGKPDAVGHKLVIETQEMDVGTVNLHLPGAHQIENCVTAVAAVILLTSAGAIAMDPKAVKSGLENVRWPGRMQQIDDDPPVVVDCAHNPLGAKALRGALDDHYPGKPVGLVWGMSGDKEPAEFIEPFLGVVERVWAVTGTSSRARPTPDLAQAAFLAGIEAEDTDLADALDQARAWARAEDGIVCVTGSLFLVGDVLGIFDF